MLAGQLTNCLADLDARLFAATQVRDEARHVEAGREIVGRLGPIYPCGSILRRTLEDLLKSKSGRNKSWVYSFFRSTCTAFVSATNALCR